MRIIEALIDYANAVKEETLYGLGFISTMIVFVTLPFALVLLMGILFYVGFVAVGYFIALSLISPKTAEKLVKEAIESRSEDNEDEEIVIEE